MQAFVLQSHSPLLHMSHLAVTSLKVEKHNFDCFNCWWLMRSLFRDPTTPPCRFVCVLYLICLCFLFISVCLLIWNKRIDWLIDWLWLCLSLYLGDCVHASGLQSWFLEVLEFAVPLGRHSANPGHQHQPATLRLPHDSNSVSTHRAQCRQVNAQCWTSAFFLAKCTLVADCWLATYKLS